MKRYKMLGRPLGTNWVELDGHSPGDEWDGDMDVHVERLLVGSGAITVLREQQAKVEPEKEPEPPKVEAKEEPKPEEPKTKEPEAPKSEPAKPTVSEKPSVAKAEPSEKGKSGDAGKPHTPNRK